MGSEAQLAELGQGDIIFGWDQSGSVGLYKSVPSGYNLGHPGYWLTDTFELFIL